MFLVHIVSSQEGWCTARFYLAQPCVKSCEVELCAHCPGHFKPSQPVAFQGDAPEWSNGVHQADSTVATPVSRCQTMRVGMCYLHSIFLIVSCSVEHSSKISSTCADCYYFFRLINHRNTIKISACIHHISFATFVIVAKMYTIRRK